MVNIQEFLNKKYPTQEEREKVEVIDIYEINQERQKEGINLNEERLEGEELDLKDFINLKKFSAGGNYFLEQFGLLNKLKKVINIAKDIIELRLPDNKLTPETLEEISKLWKLEILDISNNNLCTNLSFVKNLTNLKSLEINNNRIYGSLESLKNMNKLTKLDISNTDIDGGLEYLPLSLIDEESEFKYDCCAGGSNDENLYEWEVAQAEYEDGRVKFIIKELNFYDNNLKIWQRTHPELMLIARPWLFINPDTREEWLIELKVKYASYTLSAEEKSSIEEKLKLVEGLVQEVEKYEIETEILKKNLEMSKLEIFQEDQLTWYKGQYREIFEEIRDKKIKSMKEEGMVMSEDEEKKIEVKLVEFIAFLNEKRVGGDHKKVKDLESKNKELKEENEELKKQIEELKIQLESKTSTQIQIPPK
ncbi:MAG: hypothetical protein MRERC_7c018 [Mycoplasmataceae bacterium RC_NB112A]|nr:MAG: hypothetical protein MRERC_10c035 [Mycoplasmataceae bacterium RC_NB112A]KLL01805.1 MAG: hypothetical protein MRERC_8c018 [Mycoplasmataceae bacterium RC_NB112A]KLL01866.1 MAG: hypothetical protein MRERC_7c018 [Mycoplasmataceae bacterium RC_NB112A]